MPEHVRQRRFSPHKRPEGGYAFERLAREDPERMRTIVSRGGTQNIHLHGSIPVAARARAAKEAKRAARLASEATAAQDVL